MKKWVYLCFFMFIIGLSLFVINGYSIWSYSKVDETKKADAAIVLGAAVYDDVPSPVFQGRIDHAIELYANGVVDNIIFTGGKSEDATYTESQVAKMYALSKGVKEEHIFIETLSTITEENVQQAQFIINEQHFKELLIISDPLHMKRAVTIAKFYGLDVHTSPTPMSAYKSLSTQLPFLLRETFYYTGFQLMKPFR